MARKICLLAISKEFLQSWQCYDGYCGNRRIKDAIVKGNKNSISKRGISNAIKTFFVKLASSSSQRDVCTDKRK
jgi:hypothetical protein